MPQKGKSPVKDLSGESLQVEALVGAKAYSWEDSWEVFPPGQRGHVWRCGVFLGPGVGAYTHPGGLIGSRVQCQVRCAGLPSASVSPQEDKHITCMCH